MQNGKKEVYIIEKRSNVEIYLPDGKVLTGPRGTCVYNFLRELPDWKQQHIVGALINGTLRELTYPIDMEAHVEPVTMRHADGALIYRRSLTFLLAAAFEKLYPGLVLAVDHAVASGGFFCQIIHGEALTPDEIAQIQVQMREMVDADLSIIRSQVPIKEAIDYFQKKGMEDKVRLLKYRQKEHLVLYKLDDHWDYLHGYMVPSTGYLKWFSITPVGQGFVLRYPRRHTSSRLLPLPESRKLLETFQQYGNWLGKLGVADVGAFNDAIQSNRTREIILISEALHEQKISEIASKIISGINQVRIILIAGPSSSGKTTFSKRLAIQLLAFGVSPFALELDNYFVDRELTPRDEKGEYDFESIEALNTKLLTEQLSALIIGKEVQLPNFNFKTGKSEPGETVRLHKGEMIILEGIHGLNPALTSNISEDQIFRIYASCLTQLNLDRYNRVSTTDTRLIRRIVRDARERGYSAQQTIQRWESVRRGEKRHIFPFQDYANDMFNSALVYELAALKPLAEPLLRQVPHNSSEYVETKRLLAFLEWFLPLDAELIPDNSIVREFIGGSILKDFKLWENPSQTYTSKSTGLLNE